MPQIGINFIEHTFCLCEHIDKLWVYWEEMFNITATVGSLMQDRNQLKFSGRWGQNGCNFLLYLTTKKLLALSQCFWKFHGGNCPVAPLVVGQVLCYFDFFLRTNHHLRYSIHHFQKSGYLGIFCLLWWRTTWFACWTKIPWKILHYLWVWTLFPSILSCVALMIFRLK